jgi:hypothetical protein
MNNNIETPNNNIETPNNEMEQLLEFINNRCNMLCEIYINERSARGDGILFLTIAPNINGVREVKLFFTDNNNLDPIIKQDIDIRRNNNSSNIIYFLLFTDNNHQNIIELDIRNHITTN